MTEDLTDEQWWLPYKDILVPGYLEYIIAESKADLIRSMSFIVPGPLQTEEYIRAIMRGPLPVNYVDTPLVELRLKRQWHMFERPQPPRLDIILDETVVHRQIGGAEVLRGQLKHLLAMSELSFVTIRIIPFAIDKHFHCFDFMLLDTNTSTPTGVVYLEGVFEVALERNPLVREYYNGAFTELGFRALSPEDSQKLLHKKIAELEANMNKKMTWQEKRI